MREHSQTDLVLPRPGQGLWRRWSGGACGLLSAGLLWLLGSPSAQAQFLRLGPFEFEATAGIEVGYDSNVDEFYPEEMDPDLQQGDFYWMPEFKLFSQPVAMRPSTTVNLEGRVAYLDYFTRNDLDTELYNLSAGFDTVHPRLRLHGDASTEFSVESEVDKYVPGGASRDPLQTDIAGLGFEWNYRKLRLEGLGEYKRERHAFEEFQYDDNDEIKLNWAIYLDLFSWGSLFYSSERTYTTYIQPEPDREENENDRKFGLTGSIPLDLLAHPKISYQLGIESVDDNTDEKEGITWEPMHTITVEDEFLLSRTVVLSASAVWQNEVAENDIGFTYDVRLRQQVGARAEHGVSWIREPGATLGSTVDTDTTTYRYEFSIKDLVFYNLTLLGSAEYLLETPMEPDDAPTEKTTTLTLGLNHTRQLTRQLSRIAGYEYTYETSNFHNDGANERHVFRYALSYDF